jgi:hypothetical protein
MINLHGPMGEVNKLIVADARAAPPAARDADGVRPRAGPPQRPAREHHVDTDSALLPWLDHEIGEVQRRRDWFLKVWEGQ